MRGSEVTMRPLPSLVTSTTVPVSATAKLAPVIPMSAWRNFSRSALRATAVRTSGSAANSPWSSRENSSATCPLVLWMAGAMMCDGFSWASWMMYSPRSVSTGVIPACSRASLRSISSVAIDFDFTAIRTPRSRASRSTISRASSAVAAQCTVPPRRSTLSARRSRWTSRCWRVASLMARARSRSASPGGKPAKASLRRSMNLVVAIVSASCRNVSLSAAPARSGNGVRRSASLTTGPRRPGPGPGAPPAPRSRAG
jgi:hypothetical protein